MITQIRHIIFLIELISQAVIVHNVKPVFADITNDAGGSYRSTLKVVVRPLRIPGGRDQQVFTTGAGCHSTRDSPRRIVWWSMCGMFTCNWVTDYKPNSRNKSVFSLQSHSDAAVDGPHPRPPRLKFLPSCGSR